MKYLITGGAGFIGSNFIHYLFAKYPDAEVINLDKLTYAGNLDNLKEIENDPRYKFVKGDIADPKVVYDLVGEADVIVNFAAESHVDRSILNSEEFIRTNIVGTHVLLEAARKWNGKRFHHISTDEVYGAIPIDSKEKWTEGSPYHPRSPYSASKAGSDHLVRAYFHTYGLPVTISNCANNFGPYHYPEKLIPLAITNLLEGQKVPVYGQGKQMREWLYVEDHCSAIDVIIQHGHLGETYFVGPHEKEVNNLQLVKKILKLMDLDESSIEFVPDRPGHDAKYALDTTKIKKELGWTAQHTLDESLKKTVQWYREHEDWWQKVKRSPGFQEYYQKQYKK